MANIDQQIEHEIQNFVRQLSALVRAAAVQSVQQALGGGGGGGGGVRRAAPSAAKAPAARRGRGRIRRNPKQIEATVATVLSYIKSHPKVKSEVIRTQLKLPRPVVQDALDRLRAAKKISMKGVKRAATYSAH